MDSIFFIEADFKTVTQKFIKQGNEAEAVKKYIDEFKKLRDEQKIKDAEKRNIDFWGKQTFKSFTAFVDSLKESKNLPKKIKDKKNINGAKLITENEDWLVYLIDTVEACQLLGDDTKWCIKIPDSKWWKYYTRRMDFYFIISKNKPASDPWYKIAMGVDAKKKKRYWNSEDKEFKRLPAYLNIPKFNMAAKVKPDKIDLDGIKEEVMDLLDREITYYIMDSDNKWLQEMLDRYGERFTRERCGAVVLNFEDGENMWAWIDQINDPERLTHSVVFGCRHETNIPETYLWGYAMQPMATRLPDDLAEELQELPADSFAYIKKQISKGPKGHPIWKQKNDGCTLLTQDGITAIGFDLTRYVWVFWVDEEKLRKDFLAWIHEEKRA